MPKEERMQFRIYKISQTHIENLETEGTSFVDTVKEFVKQKSKISLNKEFKKTENETILFYGRSETQPTSWNEYFPREVKGGKNFEKTQSEFLCLYIFIETKSVYFFSGGHAYVKLLKYSDTHFPKTIASKIAKNEIKNQSSLNVTGNTLMDDEIYRELVDYSPYDNLGKIMKSFKAPIDPNKSKKINLVIPDSDNIMCDVTSTSILIRKRRSFEELISLIRDIHDLSIEGFKDGDLKTLNDIRELNQRTEEELCITKNLDEVIKEEFYKAFSMKPSMLTSFDIVPEFETFRYCKSSSFKLLYSGIENVFETPEPITSSQLVTSLRKIPELLEASNKNEFFDKLNIENLRIEATGGGHPINNRVIDMLVGEIKLEGDTYYKINKKYFEISHTYESTVNEALAEELSSSSMWISRESLGLEKWKNEDEDIYNLSQISGNSLCGDKKKIRNIEICDIGRLKEKKCHLIHVKNGFDRDMRVLSSQIKLSTNLISVLRRENNKTEFQKYTERLKSISKNNASLCASFTKHLQSAKRESLTYVMAFKDETIRDISWKALFSSDDKKAQLLYIKSKRSLIAKIELLDLLRYMRSRKVNFKLVELSD